MTTGSNNSSSETGSQNAPDRVERRDSPAILERVLLLIYNELVSNLEARLGSREAALDAVQETSLKLATRPQIGPVRNPRAYLGRMALNLACNRHRTAVRYIGRNHTWFELIADEAPDPEQCAIARSDFAAAMAALDELPERRREILLARLRDDLSLDEIAATMGIHRRTVQKELERALKYLRARTGAGLRLEGSQAP